MIAFGKDLFKFLIVVCSFFGAAHADGTESKLTINKFQLGLASIEAEKLGESGGDEVYISVAEFSNYGKPSYFRVPSYPTYWLSKHFKSVKNVRLWEREFADGEAAQLIVSVIERDLPPWNVDDLIGAVKVNIHQENGIVEIEWDHNYLQNEAKVEVGSKDADNRKFILEGNNSKYNIAFDVLTERVSEKK